MNSVCENKFIIITDNRVEQNEETACSDLIFSHLRHEFILFEYSDIKVLRSYKELQTQKKFTTFYSTNKILKIFHLIHINSLNTTAMF